MEKVNRKLRVGVVGASGAVGREIVQILQDRNFPIESLVGFSGANSAGKKFSFQNKTYHYNVLNENENFADFDLLFFAAGSRISERYVPIAIANGALVIDNASLFRMRSDVPLVVPEVNPEALSLAKKSKLIANPNCTTAQMVMILKPLHDHFGIKRVQLVSYQSVSGKGQTGIDEFESQAKNYFSKTIQTLKPKAFPHAIAFNCIPQVDVFASDGFTAEEHKVMSETKKILSLSDLRILATCVRVPVLVGHSESVSIETEKPVTPQNARNVLARFPGVSVIDEPERNLYPVASQCAGKDEVFVGRIRSDHSLEKKGCGLTMWIVADNLRKGAALNTVQIAELAISQGLIGKC